ncbi:zinc finger CCCH domain-containing protein 44 isoform X2 [Syzygium oleosum]|uniref:zinc finger CCCH domain-containing protein 44 isoform X2 n=1 Tax=Syzygium oleosum TaxID=219896 RepID=UPI0024B96D34|nr:zinc finger CCCH domain-containing protein 44 isoform X2 [Syzygium oleosum]
MTKKKKKQDKRKRDKYEESDDWCFVCKDGGELILCDHKDCSKVYHSDCVGKDDSSMQTGQSWTCDRHSCFICHKTTKYYCFCCPNAICGRCDSAAEFVSVRGNGGFCHECLKLILLIEENVDYDSDGDKLDFKDRDTYECLFKEYWEIIKEKEGLTLDHVYSADILLKKGKGGKHGSFSAKLSDSEEIFESLSESDEDRSRKKSARKVKGSITIEFEGWGSKTLIHFLKSIGEDTTKQLSRWNVDSIISKYIKEKQLFHPEKKKKVICDESLYSVFRKKTIHKNQIYFLLEPHLNEVLELSDEEESDDACGLNLQETNRSNLVASKHQRTSSTNRSTNRKLKEKEVVRRVQESCFASINEANIKLIYLRRSLIQELLKQPDSFEGKVIGSFVKVKTDPRDYLHKRPYQLLQVTGIKRTSTANNLNREILLQVLDMPSDVNLQMLSDADLTEEDCEDLQEKINSGLLKKLTVVELREKAKSLHEDVIKHMYLLQGMLLFPPESNFQKLTFSIYCSGFKESWPGYKILLNKQMRRDGEENYINI